MSLTKKVLKCGVSAVIGFGAMTMNQNRLVTNTASAWEPLSCEQIIEQFEPELEGKFFGLLGNSCLDKFKPSNAEENDYTESFSCVKDFLREYDEKRCGANEIYNKSVEAMLKNLFTRDKIVREQVRQILKIEGILDFSRQMEYVVATAEHVRDKIKAAAEDYSKADSSQKEEIQKRANSWKEYIENLRVYALLIKDSALFFMERPEEHGFPEIDEDIAHGTNLSFQGLGYIISFESHIATSEWPSMYQDFKNWKKKQEEVFETLLGIQKKATYSAILELGKGSKWVNILYQGVDGKWQNLWASKEFATEWGDNGENYYQKIRQIDIILEEINGLIVGTEAELEKTLEAGEKKSGIVRGETKAEIAEKLKQAQEKIANNKKYKGLSFELYCPREKDPKFPNCVKKKSAYSGTVFDYMVNGCGEVVTITLRYKIQPTINLSSFDGRFRVSCTQKKNSFKKKAFPSLDCIVHRSMKLTRSGGSFAFSVDSRCMMGADGDKLQCNIILDTPFTNIKKKAVIMYGGSYYDGCEP